MGEELPIRNSSGTTVSSFAHSPLKPSTADGHPIRLLHLQPAPDYYSPIKCTLEHVDLSPNLQFKALSYTWGDPDITLPIFVDDKSYHVTANCHVALLRLREVRELTLWIDAISINQRDDHEKMIQIGMMADVYYLASEVIVWLGVSEADRKPDQKEKERLAIQLVDHLSKLKEKKKNTNKTDYQIEYYFQEIESVDDVKNQWQAFALLVSHSWFERLWVLQEITVAKASRALFQFHYLEVKRIQNAVRIAYHYDQSNPIEWSTFKEQQQLDLDHEFSPNLELLVTGKNIRQAYNRDKRQLQRMSLDQILDTLRQFKCSDPKDRIFGILALLGKEIAQKIEPQYHWSIVQLYSKTALAIIEEEMYLKAICLAGMSRKRLTNAFLPTWVTDWTVERQDKNYPSPFFYELYESSARTSKAIYSLGQDSSVLKLAGICVDTVLGSMEIDLPDGEERILEWSTTKKGLSFWKSRFSHYPTDCDSDEAWISTISADRMYKNRYHYRLDEEYYQGYKKFSEATTEEDNGNKLKASEYIYYEYEYALHQSLKMRNFFVSELGYMGIGPKPLQEGDMVCVFPGCRVPLLIRKEADHHLLVGECFVWGLMDGEAWEGKEVNSWKDKKFEELTDEDGLEIFYLH
jgi:hypothetical protein